MGAIVVTSLPRHFLTGSLVAAVGVAVHLGLAAAQSVPLGLPLDDAWIHAAVARNLATGNGWSLFPPVAGGESSPLWPLWLAPAEWIPGVGAPLLALLLGLAAWLWLPAVVAELVPRPALRRATAAVIAMCGPLTFHALSGMETLPALLACCLGLWEFSRERTGRAALWVGAACWLRPDAILLGAVLVVGEIDARRDAGVRTWAAGAQAVFAIWPAWLLFALAVGWLSWMNDGFPPSTLAGRRWAMGLSPELGAVGWREAVPPFVWSWPQAISRDLGLGAWTASWGTPGAGLRWIWKAVAALVLTVGLFRAGRDAGRPRPRAAFRLLVVWALWTVVFYGLVLPDRGHVGRYQPQVYLALLGLGVVGVDQLRRTRLAQAAWGLSGVLLLGLSSSMILGGFLWVRSVEHLHRVHGRAAAAVGDLLSEGAHVAVFDVGRVAYDTEGQLADISGLSDPELLTAMASGDLSPSLKSRGVTHLLLPVFGDDTAPGSLRHRLGLAGPEWEEIQRWESPVDRWAPSFHYAGHAYRRLVLYRTVDAVPIGP